MKLLTVFTPTFNRANCLGKLYESLKRQECKDFEWLIVDDGSTDNTRELVKAWEKQNNGFDIRYYYKENGGLHTGYNVAIEHLNTELAMCIDSDDWLTDDCVITVKNIWEEKRLEDVAGIIGLDVTESGEILGELPNSKKVNLWDIACYKFKNIKYGDRKLVIKSALYKAVAPMPTLNGEKNFNPQYMHLKIATKYEFLVLNKPLCVVEYQANGMTANIFRQYLNSPNSFIEQRKLFLSQKLPLKIKVKNIIHLISSCIIAKKNPFKEYKNFFGILFLYPFGFALSVLVKRKGK